MNPVRTITVVIPVYNRATLVGRLLHALDAQTCRDFSVILVDNGSTDGTPDVLARWSRQTDLETTIAAASQRGASAARAAGLRLCKSEWVMFFDSDDTMSPGHMARAVEAIRSHTDADVIGWDIWYTSEGTRSKKPFVTKDIKYRVLFDGTMSTQRYMARRKIFEKAGSWDNNIPRWNDIELGARILELNPTVYKSEGEPTVEVWVQPDSITNAPLDIESIERALDSIASRKGYSRRWIDLKETILAARTPGRQGSDILRRVIFRTSSNRLLLRLAYAYTRLGGRGIARILRPFM